MQNAQHKVSAKKIRNYYIMMVSWDQVVKLGYSCATGNEKGSQETEGGGGTPTGMWPPS